MRYSRILPVSSRKIPGALHQANDEHIERLIARHGAVTLIRQLAEDLAHRDAQAPVLRRRAEDRRGRCERLVVECGPSNLDLETRLRTIERETKSLGPSGRDPQEGLTDLMSDAMSEEVGWSLQDEGWHDPS